MLIDDSPVSNFISKGIMQLNNFADNIVVSEFPDEALKLLKEGSVAPDIIFLDIEMPRMDGFQFLEEYDKIEIDKSHTKIFMLSSSVNPIDIERAKANKYVSRFISKSLTPGILLELAS